MALLIRNAQYVALGLLALCCIPVIVAICWKLNRRERRRAMQIRFESEDGAIAGRLLCIITTNCGREISFEAYCGQPGPRDIMLDKLQAALAEACPELVAPEPEDTERPGNEEEAESRQEPEPQEEPKPATATE